MEPVSGCDCALCDERHTLHHTITQWKAASKVQSVLCSRKRFKTAEAARKWVVDHKFVASKLDTTTNYYRFRQFDPSLCSTTPRTITLSKGVKAIICQKK